MQQGISSPTWVSRPTPAELDPHAMFAGGGIVWQWRPLAGELEPESLVHGPGSVVAVGDPRLTVGAPWLVARSAMARVNLVPVPWPR